MRDLVVIPARFSSSRLPGKPLVAIAGRTLLERVVDLARRAVRDRDHVAIVVATDDRRIADHAEALGCEVTMTDPAITSGSGRALSAARQAQVAPRFIVNLQGDAPFLPATALAHVLRALADGAAVATPVVPLSWAALDQWREHKRVAPFSGTACIRGTCGHAVWFSKTIVPAIRDEAALRAAHALSPVFRHLGLYGYTLTALEAFEALPPSRYERLEGLEQLRLIEAGIPIRTVLVDDPDIAMSGIDTSADVALAEQLIARHGDPFGT